MVKGSAKNWTEISVEIWQNSSFLWKHDSVSGGQNLHNKIPVILNEILSYLKYIEISDVDLI